jgi:hypothetical protein
MEKATEILVQALKEAMARTEEQPLYKSGKQPGLFASRTGMNAEAADIALRDGFLEIVRTESRGKTEVEWVRITPRGVQFVYQHESPKAVLEELVGVLRPGREALPRWLEEMRAQFQAFLHRAETLLERQYHQLGQLLQRAEEALRRLMVDTPASPLDAWHLDALDYLERHRIAAQTRDCPLPALFLELRQKHPELTLATFHEGLQRLRDRGAITLVTFGGHLSELKEPEYALLEGAAVYYMVRRS